MSELIDIRRTIKIDKKVTGIELVNALKKVAEQIGLKYSKKLLYELDGKKTLIVGIESLYPHQCVMARTGENLFNNGIRLEDFYKKIGVGSSNELLPKMVYATSIDDCRITKAVERIRDGLEKIL